LKASNTKKLAPLPHNSTCLAKWLQVTIDLHHGVSKSCHHTRWTEIDPKNIIENPQELHNTVQKDIERTQMLSNIKPESCNYCWRHEKKISSTSSDRFQKSNSDWANFGYDQDPFDQKDPTPSYVEVMFDKICNLSCAYCSPDSSSKIENEIKKLGPFPDLVNEHRSSRLVPSPYKSEFIKSFFNWLPHLLPKLHTLRVTGGEPLLSHHTFKLIDYLGHRENKHLIFSLNTNLMLSDHLLTQFYRNINKLQSKVKEVHIYTSLEAHGQTAEYIRQGLNYPNFMINLKQLLKKCPQTQVTIIATINKLVISNFDLFLLDIAKLKSSHKRLCIDFVPLQQPDFLSIESLTTIEKEKFIKSCQVVLEKNSVFNLIEREKIKFILKLVSNDHHDQKKLQYKYQVFKGEFNERYPFSSP